MENINGIDKDFESSKPVEVDYDPVITPDEYNYCKTPRRRIK